MHECLDERGVIINTMPCSLHAEKGTSPWLRVGMAMGTVWSGAGNGSQEGNSARARGKNEKQSKTKSRRNAPEVCVVGMQRGEKTEENLGKKNRKMEGSRVVK